MDIGDAVIRANVVAHGPSIGSEGKRATFQGWVPRTVAEGSGLTNVAFRRSGA